MKYPTAQEILAATHIQLARWYRFLKSPENVEQAELMELILRRFEIAGGMKPEISKEIGW